MKTIQIVIICATFIILALLGFYFKQRTRSDFVEDFSNYSLHAVNETPKKIYNQFYAEVYDNLFNATNKNYYEISSIKKYTIEDNKHLLKKNIKFLDLGCGTGNHLQLLDNFDYKCVGLDISKDMLDQTQIKIPHIPLLRGDFLNKSAFKKGNFSHITCLYYTIYYTNKLNDLFTNVNHWLAPGGFFCIHLVSKSEFDPILESASSLIPLYDPQKHASKRVTKTKLKFNQFNYVADWDFSDKNTTSFTEHFMFKDNSKHIENQHTFHMYPINTYKRVAKKTGFTLHRIVDLAPVNHENNYIYIFRKVFG